MGIEPAAIEARQARFPTKPSAGKSSAARDEKHIFVLVAALIPQGKMILAPSVLQRAACMVHGDTAHARTHRRAHSRAEAKTHALKRTKPAKTPELMPGA
eukprot:COSAG02_NODE_32552_length_514_cov_1.590361_1_plen_100_part_00